MNPRIEYEMTEEDLKELLDACEPVTCMMIGGYTPSTPQENANRAWEKLGKKMGFDSTTVRPLEKGQRFFSAVPSETEAQKQARIQREQEVKRQEEIRTLEKDIATKQSRLSELRR